MHDEKTSHVNSDLGSFLWVCRSLIISSVLLTDSISSSNFSRVLPPAAMPRSPAAGPCCPLRPSIWSTTHLPHPQGRGGGRSNSTLVIGKLRGPETRILYEAVQVGTARNPVSGDHSRCVRPVVCVRIEGGAGRALDISSKPRRQ